MRFNWFTYHRKLTVPFMVNALWRKHTESLGAALLCMNMIYSHSRRTSTPAILEKKKKKSNHPLGTQRFC